MRVPAAHRDLDSGPLPMMTLHKLHAGDGYAYLTRQVAAGDEGRSPGQQLTDYYTASGNPPGRWLGAGAADLEVCGRVREDQMRARFGRGLHPDAEQIVALEVAAGTTPEDAAQAVKLGRAFPQYKSLPPRSERVAARRIKTTLPSSSHTSPRAAIRPRRRVLAPSMPPDRASCFTTRGDPTLAP